MRAKFIGTALFFGFVSAEPTAGRARSVSGRRNSSKRQQKASETTAPAECAFCRLLKAALRPEFQAAFAYETQPLQGEESRGCGSARWLRFKRFPKPLLLPLEPELQAWRTSASSCQRRRGMTCARALLFCLLFAPVFKRGVIWQRLSFPSRLLLVSEFLATRR